MRRLHKHVSTHLRNFLALEAAGGIVMIAAAVGALILANSPYATQYRHALAVTFALDMNLSLFTKDVLMAIFFLAVGMELKCEMREGALAAKGQKILPLIAAIGGVILPACIYLAITHSNPQYRAGWAIPTATDIAFALCVLRLVGASVPQAAKMFLLAVAIYDDLAAILIIAFFYSGDFAAIPLLEALGIGAAFWVLNRLHISSTWLYLALGALMWNALHHAGIHPTVAGVITGIAIPMRTKQGEPLLQPLLHALHPYVAFCILPLFAFTTAGITLGAIPMADALSILPVGIACALFFGKQLGIFAATFACVKFRLAPLPGGMNWRMVYGIAILAGIGFTMSLFIGKLAFGAATQDILTLGVLGGSLLSALFGAIFLQPRRTS